MCRRSWITSSVPQFRLGALFLGVLETQIFASLSFSDKFQVRIRPKPQCVNRSDSTQHCQKQEAFCFFLANACLGDTDTFGFASTMSIVNTEQKLKKVIENGAEWTKSNARALR